MEPTLGSLGGWLEAGACYTSDQRTLVAFHRARTKRSHYAPYSLPPKTLAGASALSVGAFRLPSEA